MNNKESNPYDIVAKNEPLLLLDWISIETQSYKLTSQLEALGSVPEEYRHDAIRCLSNYTRHESVVVREGVVYGLSSWAKEESAFRALDALSRSDMSSIIRSLAAEALK